MTNLFGEYDCRLDPKSRLKMPAPLLKQLGEGSNHIFYLNRGFEKNLVLYPENVWKEITLKIGELSYYNTTQRNFLRYFFRGVKEVQTDGAERILLSKNLLEYADIKSDVVLFAFIDKIEIWDKDAYDGQMNEKPEDFARLADDIFGGINPLKNL